MRYLAVVIVVAWKPMRKLALIICCNDDVVSQGARTNYVTVCILNL